MVDAFISESAYVLAIDIGTSRIAAATARMSPRGGVETAPFALGRKGDSVATVVFVTEDGGLLFGDAAERRGVAQPERLVREFKRNIGDRVPVTVGGRTLQAEELYAQTFAAVIDAVAEREGGLPAAVSFTHPTVWGGHRLGLVHAALSRLGIRNVVPISEPEAAARHYEATRPLEPGQALAVYDLGGGTFDAVVLRKGEESSFEIVGDPAGIDDLGGADFDDAVFRHVITSAGIDPAASDVDDPDTRIALAQLRREAVDAKEALSFDSDATVPVLFPPSRSSVRITRSEFEAMIEGAVDRTVDTLEDAIDSAALTPGRLEAILLIGGSSRIPLVAQRLSETFDRPLAIDADPKAAIALGAARTALLRLHDDALGSEAALPVGTGTALALVGGTAPTGAELATRPAPTPPSSARRGSPLLMAGAAVVIAGAIVFGSTVAAGSRSDDEVAGTGVQTTQSPKPTPTPTPTGADPVAPAVPPGSAVVEQPQTRTAPNPRRAESVRTKPTPRATPAPGAPKATQSSPLPSSGSASTGADAAAADTATPDPTTGSPVPTSEPPAPSPAPEPTTTAPPATEPPAPDPTPEPTTTDPPTTEPTAPPPVEETPNPGPV